MNTNLEFAMPVQWNIENEYNLNDVVLNNEDAYTAINYVPSGTSLNNNSYWKKTGKYIRTDNIADGSITTPKFAENAITKNILPNVISQNGTGTTVTTDDSGYLAALSIDGKSIQDGTPTPSNPVDVKVVQGRNIFKPTPRTVTANGVTYSVANDGKVSLTGTATANNSFSLVLGGSSEARTYNAGTYTMSKTDGISRVSFGGLTFDTSLTHTFTAPFSSTNMAVYITNGTVYNESFYVQLEEGSTVNPYTPYGSITLNINGTITPIDLQGNVLASLPDGTKDVLTVDSVGHVVLEKRIDYIISYNGESIGDVYISTTGELTTGASVYYKLTTPQTIDIGYIDIPQISNDSIISITATIVPNIEISYWIDNGMIISEQLINTFNNINNLINVLASSIAKVENDVASSNYSVGSYLVMNNVLYKVTSSITNGENIVAGTNVVSTTVMEEVINLTS